MQLCDVNVLVYARRKDVAEHLRYRAWLENLLNGPETYAVSELVLSGFVRVVTHPGIFKKPTATQAALEFCELIRTQPTAVIVSPGARHWDIFSDLCGRAGAKGNLVPDAYHAALAIESGAEWITTDRGFARFPGLRWRHPLS